MSSNVVKYGHLAGLKELSPADLDRVCAAFDRQFYLDSYPDVEADGMDPFVHYTIHGWGEGRDPSPDFSTFYYLSNNADIAEAGMNPFVHWTLHGSSEGRFALPTRFRVTGQSIKRLLALTEVPGLEQCSPEDAQRVRDAFDPDFYLSSYPDVREAGVDPFLHYMALGWQEQRDPCRQFSTAYYLRHNPDISAAGMNPLVHWVLHGISEMRPALPFYQRFALQTFEPKVSAIVPNYNHAPFLAERIDSILNQTYRNIDLLILDDCSTDESREIIDSYVKKYPGRVRSIFNSKNTRSVFKQWRKGVEATDGAFIWICESDDFCEPDFVEKLLPYFRDPSVNIAFGRILETSVKGVPDRALDNYREGAEPGIWDTPLIRPAREWFANGFGVNNVIANVGGCLWRRPNISPALWDEAQGYGVIGDWFLYIHVAGGGQIAWDPTATSYFRRHGANTSTTSAAKPGFYQELERLMLALRKQWTIPDTTVERFYEKVRETYNWYHLEEKLGPLDQYCDKTKLLAHKEGRPHILMAFYGFIPGGGENFPLNLANHLHAKGWLVSMLGFEMRTVNTEMRAALNPAIAVYDASWVDEFGADRFVSQAGISLVHSHTVGAEFRFFELWKLRSPIPYLVTLHGSYEASEMDLERTARLASRVSHFVYTADKNLGPLRGLALTPSEITKLPNAMPLDPRPFPKSRSELGIAEDAVVFTLVARGIVRKGWRASIEAFQALRARHPKRRMHLLLCGDGDEPDRHQAVHGDDPDITFLGYQSRIHGLYEISDVAIVPTRFSGESFPLCIIQSLQTGTPVVASRVGEIESMIVPTDGPAAGPIIEPVRDTPAFIRSLTNAMELMLDEQRRRDYAHAARQLGTGYDMDKLVEVYGALYRRMIADRTETTGRDRLADLMQPASGEEPMRPRDDAGPREQNASAQLSSVDVALPPSPTGVWRILTGLWSKRPPASE